MPCTYSTPERSQTVRAGPARALIAGEQLIFIPTSRKHTKTMSAWFTWLFRTFSKHGNRQYPHTVRAGSPQTI